jgi:hypothetical protein
MGVIAQIIEARTGGEVIAATVDRCFSLAEQAAPEFGLSAKPEIYEQISPDEAVEVLASVIHKDMAYGYEFTPLEQARQLASSFVFSFPPLDTTYFTNGSFGKPRENPNVGPSWSPATDATFDTGVLVLSGVSTSCLWFKDED